MTLEDLRTELQAILAAEERSPTDWHAVEERCWRVVERLNMEPEPTYPHAVVYHYLKDADARQKSATYGASQRER